MAVNPGVKALFAKMSDAASVEARTGAPNWWPAHGEHEADVIAWSCEPCKVPRKPDKMEVDAVRARFQYQLVEDPESPDGTPRKWWGDYMTVVADTSTLTEPKDLNGRKAQLARLKGHIQILLGRPVENPLTALDEIETLLSSEKGVTVVVFCEHGSYKKADGTDGYSRRDFLVKNLSR